MPRNKKGTSARGAKSSRGGRGGRGGRYDQATPRGRGRAAPGLAYMANIEEIAGFTLADEARQTSQHDHTFQNSNLRQRPVKFVSAGKSEPLKLLDELLEANEHGPAKDHVDPEAWPEGETMRPVTLKQPNIDEAEDNEREEGEEEEQLIGPEELEESIQIQDIVKGNQDTAEEHLSFFFDLKGNPALTVLSEQPVNIPDRPSSSSSGSSEEVILFKGRDAQRKVQAAATEISMTQIQTEIQIVEEQIIAGSSTLSTQTRKGTKMRSKNRQPTQQRKAQRQANDEEDAIIADYIENMRENDDADDFLADLAGNRRDLGGTDYYIPDDLSSEDDSEEPDDKDEINADGPESEIDDVTLAKLITGQNPDADEGDVNYGESLSDSSSSSDEKKVSKPADANDEFDLMDWERPSLRRKKKGKGVQAQINFNVSDSELEQTLQAAWKNDRLKKSERKKQREQLRALGMLGKKADPEDLRIKYPDGMSMEQVADEFRSFLMGTDETVILPPMDNHARKMIHELATKFKIKSKSIGKAEQRRPTLIRTLRTLPYVESTFDQATGRISRRYFPRLALKGKQSQRAPHQVRGNHRAATYQDGEIIGAAAPELGTENRGRAMLEKMGWSSGTALGATDNKGILQPVTQTMKRSKAGLG